MFAYYFLENGVPLQMVFHVFMRKLVAKQRTSYFPTHYAVGNFVAKSPVRSVVSLKGGALGGTRTPTILLTATSRQRVYQFRHERFGYRLDGCGLPDQRRRCNKSEMGGQGGFATELTT
jgi:hypothetical protein